VVTAGTVSWPGLWQEKEAFLLGWTSLLSIEDSEDSSQSFSARATLLPHLHAALVLTTLSLFVAISDDVEE